MNRLMVLMMFAASFAFAACGGGANNAGGGNAANTGGNEAGHSHEDGGHHHEGEEHDLGHRTKDDWHYGAKQIGDPEAGGELVFEVHLQKGGENVKDATIATWVGDDSGKELSPRGSGAWVEDEGVYDCHVGMPKDIPAKMKFWVEVKHGGSVVFKDSFDVAME
ncbi:MAG: hypothetical protein KDB90_14090 [Planctomycetes bacterium]|nr:hypothetical protein [Planctomycetota bacterium]